MKVAIVVSRFNELITKELTLGAEEVFKAAGLGFDVYWVPGAHEIPVTLQWLARSKRYQGLLALGCVIKGDTHHFEVVVDAVNQGTLRVSLDESLPIATGVLTTYTLEQAMERIGGKVGHKGKESASALIEMLELRNSLTL